MGGQNPYIQDSQVKLPKKPYELIIVDEEGKEHALTITPEKIPYDDHGLPGSILDIAMAHHIALDHACGGVCACATCHVQVLQGASSLNEATEDELDQLEEAYDLKPSSRLGCQCVPDGSCDVRVRIPTWNRNLARE